MIEFVKGEGFCRWNGTLMNPENCVKMFGVGLLDVKLLTEDELIDKIDSTCHRILCGYYEERS